VAGRLGDAKRSGRVFEGPQPLACDSACAPIMQTPASWQNVQLARWTLANE